MNITIFTGASKRHDFLIKSLLDHNLFVIRENKKSFSFLKSKYFIKNKLIKDYFKKVQNAEKKIFGGVRLNRSKINYLKEIKYREVNKLSIKKLKKYLNSDLYIVFGSSLIKNDLLEFLIEKKCINLHMGISPYYKGSNCNFWAIIHGNYHLVGATIHRLSSEIDGGDILFQTITKRDVSPFIYSMKNVKAAITLLVNKINNKKLFAIKPKKQIKKKIIMYSKNSDFSEKVLKNFPKKINKFKFKKKMLIKPEFFNE
mgnify:CR=1 FL=1|tara:strand:+ start:352 stop:1122 length:771 start_codon:yes stop_codon:yes gene_type:complete